MSTSKKDHMLTSRVISCWPEGRVNGWLESMEWRAYVQEGRILA